jgi:hypothetical protein
MPELKSLSEICEISLYIPHNNVPFELFSQALTYDYIRLLDSELFIPEIIKVNQLFLEMYNFSNMIYFLKRNSVQC